MKNKRKNKSQKRMSKNKNEGLLEHQKKEEDD